MQTNIRPGGGESNHNRITSRLKGAIKEILGDSTSLFLLGIFLLVSIVSIGYSALSSSLMVTGEANFRVREDIRITGIKVLSFENEGYETYTAEYYKDGTKVMVTLPKTDSKVTYEVEIKNTSENSYQLKEIKDEIASNPHMKYEIQGLNLEDIIGPGETKTFQIVVSYQDGTSEVPNENTVTFETRYVFEIFHVIPPQTGNSFANYLKSIANPDTITAYEDVNGNKQEMYTFKHEATEQTDMLTDYRYIGNIPNNYVYFNCKDNSNVSTCEKWRIIGVFPVEDEYGNVEEKVKIIKDTSIGDKAWDSNEVNNWETASLNEYLNGTYYDGLSYVTKAMIENTKYYLGGNNTQYNLEGSDYYKFERGTSTPSGAPSSLVGKIGLMYPSDYVYTYALGVDDKCYMDGYYCDEGAPSLGWLYKNNTDWTLAPYVSSSDDKAFYVDSTGRVNNYYSSGRFSYGVSFSWGIRPTLYLYSGVLKEGGTGSVSDPYILGLLPKISFDFLSGTYVKSRTITITVEDTDYSHMNVEVRNSNGRIESKSQNNIAENTYTVILEEEDTYTISVTAYDESGHVTQAEQRYIIREPVNAIEKWKAKANSSNSYTFSTSIQKKEMYAFHHKATEQTGELTDYRYIGDSPNNYVYFNCTDESDTSTCETWRIIGVFPVEWAGKIEERVKIIKDDSIGSMTWDNDSSDWTKADLNTYLNGTYLSSLSSTTQSMIGYAKYYLGESKYYQSVSGENYYKFERGTTTYNYNSRSNYWSGKIGLMYASDYVYTYALGVNDTCYKDGYGCSKGSPSLGWLYKNRGEWTLTTLSEGAEVFFLTGNGGVYLWDRWASDGNSSSYVARNYGVRPVLYLASNVSIIDGDGSSDNPYQIGLSPVISFDYVSGTYYMKPMSKTITITAKDDNYSHMDVEVRDHNGRIANKSQNNITENKYTVTFEEEGTYTISVKAYDEVGLFSKSEQQYVIKKPGDAAEKLKSKVNVSELTYTDSTEEQRRQMYAFQHEATEQTGELTDYRYIGNTPNNYVYFNCTSETQSSSTCETWRIIGIFSVDDGTGYVEERMKIIRETSIGNNAWDSEGVNNWKTASLNTYLNGTYYNGLSDTAKAMIGDTKYYLGGSSTQYNLGGPDYYKFERGNTVPYGNPKYWEGKIALMYLSDYVYTYALGVNDKCYTDADNCDDGSPSAGWLFNSANQWTLVPYTGWQDHAFYVDSSGDVYYSYPGDGSYYNSFVTRYYGVRPALYLASSVSIVDGDGSSDDPYQLMIK